ncbi:MAG: hypothetical protein ABEJ87_03000 [Candidatus Nanohalobium sp.]
MIDHEKLTDLGYTAYQHFKDMEGKLEDEGLYHPAASVGKDCRDGVHVVEVDVYDPVADDEFSETYRLEGVNEEEFEEVMHGIWESAFMDLEL